MIDRIREYLKNEELKVTKRGDSIDVMILGKKIGFTVVKGKGWEEVKKYIDKVTSDMESKDKLCNICFEEGETWTNCSKCANRWCMECMLKTMRKTCGISICPYCRYTVGMRVPSCMVDHLERSFRIRRGLPCPVH